MRVRLFAGRNPPLTLRSESRTSFSPESDPGPSCAKAAAPLGRSHDPVHIAPEATVRSSSPAPRGASPTRGLGAKCGPQRRALAHASSLDTDRTRNARAPTSTRSIGFCAIWVCISSGFEFEFNVCFKGACSLPFWPPSITLAVVPLPPLS